MIRDETGKNPKRTTFSSTIYKVGEPMFSEDRLIILRAKSG